jgi:hypothetical protein
MLTGSYEKLCREVICAVVGAGGASGVAGGAVGSAAGVVPAGAAAGQAGSAGVSHFFLQVKILPMQHAETSWPARSRKELATIRGATSFNMVGSPKGDLETGALSAFTLRLTTPAYAVPIAADPQEVSDFTAY